MINIPTTKKLYYSAVILLLITVIMFADLLFNSVFTGLLNFCFFQALMINMLLLIAVFYSLSIYNERILSEIKELKEVFQKFKSNNALEGDDNQ